MTVSIQPEAGPMFFALRGLRMFVVLCCLNAATARAATTCTFETHGNTWLLQADCQTDETLRIPDAFTLDGQGHRITAVDPPAGHFLGAIVRNAGSVAHVRNVVLDTQQLASICDPATPSDLRLRGILFESASGSIVGNRVLNINQGESGCQEGFGIEARNPPYDGNHPATARVTIAGNHVERYQKTGILVNGDVDASVSANTLVGLGTVNFIAQNGIQLGFGAQGKVRLNRVSQNLYTGAETLAAGILLIQSEPESVGLNRIADCDTGIALDSATALLVTANRVTGSARFGIIVAGDANALLGNRVDDTQGVGLYVSGQDNLLQGNSVRASSELDIYNEGANDYSLNRCSTSTGAPVDCP